MNEAEDTVAGGGATPRGAVPRDAVSGGAVPGPGQVLYVCSDDVAALDLPIGEVVDAVESAFRLKGDGVVDMPPKVTMQGGGGAFAQVMPAWVGAAASDRAAAGDAEATGEHAAASLLGVKLVTVTPGNVGRGLPVTNALIVLDDPRSGLPQAIVDGGRVTALRTGAGVGVAARHLAASDVSRAGVLGCGVQARTAVRALAAVLRDLVDVRCHDVVPRAAAAFVEEVPRLVEADDAVASPASRRRRAVGVRACARPDEVCRGAGVVVTAITMGAGEPPLGAGLLEPGALAVALDYDAAWTAAAMAECDLFVTDDTTQTLATREHGPRLAGIPAVDADLGDIVAGRVGGRSTPGQRVFCLNLGVAVADLVTAWLVCKRAARAGLGRRLPI